MIDLFQGAITNHTTVKLTGVWRLWAEHGGNTDQKQGAAVEPADDTNPDHIFEIHPIITINGTNFARDTFVPITGST
jgi:hypothetical protein